MREQLRLHRGWIPQVTSKLANESSISQVLAYSTRRWWGKGWGGGRGGSPPAELLVGRADTRADQSTGVTGDNERVRLRERADQ